MRKVKLIIALVISHLFCFGEFAFPEIVSKREVQSISQSFLTWKSTTQTAALNKQIFRSIDRIEELTDPKDNEVLAHIVIVEPKGFLVISTDTDLEPIIAYSFRHDWSPDTSRANVVYQILLLDMKLRIEAITELPADIIEQNNQKWQRGLRTGDMGFFSSPFYQWPEEGTTVTGGWIETTWRQDSPYNSFCPLDPQDKEKSGRMYCHCNGANCELS